MKKISLLLVLVIVFSLTACAQTGPQETEAPGDTTVPETTVEETTIEETTIEETTIEETTAPPTFTLYMPETMSVCAPDGTVATTVVYTLEEGWEEKETFSAIGVAEIPGQGTLELKTIYADRYTASETPGVLQTETYHDEQGRLIKTLSVRPLNPDVDKTETLQTYDEHGRIMTVETRTYARGQAEPTVETVTYTYTDTDTGSKGTCDNHGMSQELVYDRNYRQVANITLVNGQEISRNEFAFDEHGNIISQKQYVQGQLVMENRYTFIAVEVGAATAARLPQFLGD